MGGKAIHVIVHRKPFKFDGIDRISILGAALDQVQTPIPFAEKEVDEEQVPYQQSTHALHTGNRRISFTGSSGPMDTSSIS